MVTKISQKKTTAAKTYSEEQMYRGFEPAKVKILSLSGFQKVDEDLGELIVYVSLLDAFDCQIKFPAIFRIEVYKRVSRSPVPEGQRVFNADMNLTKPSSNDEYWEDYLRAYKFHPDFEPEREKDYILRVTAIYPGGMFLTDSITLSTGR